MLVLIWGVVVFIGCISWDKVEPDLRLSLGWLLVSSPLCLWDSGKPLVSKWVFSY